MPTSLKFAIRGLQKYKLNTLVNLLGLTLGIASTLIIFLYVVDELRYDRHHEDAEQIFQIVAERQVPGQGLTKFVNLPGPLAAELEAGFSEIEESFRMIMLGRANLAYENNGYYEFVVSVDPEFFQMLDYDFIQGDAATALTNPDGIVITQSTATKYFGDEDPIGKVLTGSRGQTVVTAVIEEAPPNSHLQLDAIFPFPSYLDSFIPDWQSNWGNNAFATYLRLSEGVEVQQLEEAISAYIRNQSPLPDAESYSFSLLGLPDIHFQSNDIVSGQVNFNPGNVSVIYTLETIALFLVLIAAINYTNLATARSTSRANEISLRKMMGAKTPQLITQFLVEAVVLSFLAFILALSIVQMLLPVINGTTGKMLTLSTITEPVLLSLIVFMVLALGVISGAYPAFVLSRQTIAKGLSNRQASVRSSGLLRKFLVVVQFSQSVVLVFCTLVVAQQMSFVQNKPLGFDQTDIIAIDINSGPVRDNVTVIRNELLNNPNVIEVSNSSRLPGDWKPHQNFSANIPGRDAEFAQEIYAINIDENFADTFAINLIEGRNLTAVEPAENVVVNQTLVDRMNWEFPLGQRLTIAGVQRASEVLMEATVVGVVEDFHFQSLHQTIQPLVLGSNTEFQPFDYFSVKVNSNDTEETLAYLKAVVERHDPETPFEYNFLDARIDTFYNSDRITAMLFTVSSGMAIFIACMGLFGLASFAIQQRTKEVGIRKVLGASITGIVRLLSADFMKPVAIAVAVGLPLGFYLMQQWLQTFAYYQQVGFGVFLLSAVLAVVVSMATVSVQSMKAALLNPVESIGYE